MSFAAVRPRVLEAFPMAERFFGPFRRRLSDGRVEFLGYDGQREWCGIVAPDAAGYEEQSEWWWKTAPLSVQVTAFLRYWRMSPEQAAAATGVPVTAVLAVLGLVRLPHPVMLDARQSTLVTAVESRSARVGKRKLSAVCAQG